MPRCSAKRKHLSSRSVCGFSTDALQGIRGMPIAKFFKHLIFDGAERPDLDSLNN